MDTFHFQRMKAAFPRRHYRSSNLLRSYFHADYAASVAPDNLLRTVLASTVRVNDNVQGLLRRHSAICRASQASCAVMRGDIDQPITARDHRSMTTARYSQPSSVRKYVMSPAHFWFRATGVKSCSNRFSDTGRPCAPVADQAELPGGLCPQSLTAQACRHGFTLKGNPEHAVHPVRRGAP